MKWASEYIKKKYILYSLLFKKQSLLKQQSTIFIRTGSSLSKPHRKIKPIKLSGSTKSSHYSVLKTDYSNEGKPSTFLNQEIQQAFREFLYEEIKRRQGFDCKMKKLCDERGSLNFDGTSLPDLASSRFRIMLVATCNYLWQTRDHHDCTQLRSPRIFPDPIHGICFDPAFPQCRNY